jgi:hypothetical protein
MMEMPLSHYSLMKTFCSNNNKEADQYLLLTRSPLNLMIG